MESALLDLATNGQTNHPMLVAVLKARKVNQTLGGAFFDPVSINECPEEIIEAVEGLTDDLPDMREGVRKVEEYREKWRRKQLKGK